jgi:hypothetical protein
MMGSKSNSRLLVVASSFAVLCICGTGLAASQPAGAGTQPVHRIYLPSRTLDPSPSHPDWNALFAGIKGPRLHAIVQLEQVPDALTRRALMKAGIELGQPIGGRAWIATLRRGLDDKRTELQSIRWVGRLAPADKLATALRSGKGAAWAHRDRGRVEVLIKVFSDAPVRQVASRVTALGGRIRGMAESASLLSASLPVGSETSVAALDDVRFVEAAAPPGRIESDRARRHVHAFTPWPTPATSVDGTGVMVGVFEPGHPATNHPDFGNRVVLGDGNDLSTGLEATHATMVSGMIAGNGTASLSAGAGQANQWRGMAPGASVRAYSYNNGPRASPTAPGETWDINYVNDVLKAVRYDGVVVLNNSWGTDGCDNPYPYGTYQGFEPFLDSVVRGFACGIPPVTVVFSAGNERSGILGMTAADPIDQHCIGDHSPPYFNYFTLDQPHSAKNILVVGAVDSFTNAITNTSSWGPTRDGRIKPDVVASGHHDGTMDHGISVLDRCFGDPEGSANQQCYRAPNDDWQGRAYAWLSQTSGAAAMVSGGVALMIDAWRRTFAGQPDPLPSTNRALLVHNAVDLVNGWFSLGPDYASGWGLMQIDETVASLRRGEAIERAVGDQGTTNFLLTVPPGRPSFKVTLAWDDLPGLEGADRALINDLDLIVTDPAGMRHFPWTLNPMQPDLAATRTSEDHLNNVEQVQVDGAAAGVWRVTVRGSRVEEGPQRFSLVAADSLWLRPCENGRTICDNGGQAICTSLSSDPQDCGACGKVCASSFAAGAICSGGECQCLSSQTFCPGGSNSVCAALSTDPRNCGQCGHTCLSSEVCTNGHCGSCSAGLTACSGDCKNLLSDHNNCGHCGSHCDSSQYCLAGHCSSMCRPACTAPSVCCQGGKGRFGCSDQRGVCH